MKKKLVLIGMIFLALVLTVGTFAYTYTNLSATTLDVALAGETITTYEPSAEPPTWDDILPEGEYDSEILLPNATGDVTNIQFQSPDSGEHWDKVDDIPPDDEDTYVATNSKHYKTDLYNLTDHMQAEGYETINSVTVYFRFNGDQGAEARAVIKTNGKFSVGSKESHAGGAFVTRSYQWEVNPDTNEAWTWEEIDALQAGFSLKGKKSMPTSCTQVYVVVGYEFVIFEGEVPDGHLFDITPHPEYTGDLLVKVYLTNTGALNKAYQYLNMKLYVDGSLEANKTPDYLILSMENGVALFNIEGESAESYTVEIIGGSYRLISGDYTEWGEGWSIIPEFYCEVTQR